MSVTIGTQTLTQNPYFGTDNYTTRINQFTRYTADGGESTYDNGADILKGIVLIKNVTKAEGKAFKTWLTDVAVYQLNSFSITPPPNTDIGNGDGIALTNCNYAGGNTTKGVVVFKAPGWYDITFPYRWKVV